MGLYSKEKYSEQEVERLYEFLRIYQERDEPIFYEIIVDDFKVVRKTSDLNQFDTFKRFLKANTKAIEFYFFMGTSNNCDKYILYFGDDHQDKVTSRDSKDKGLSGIEVQQMVNDKLLEQRQQLEMIALVEKNKALEVKCTEQQEQIQQLEEEVETLEEEKREELAKRSPLQGLFGEVGAGIVEAVIRRNPQTVASLIPGGEALSGLLERDEKARMQQLSGSGDQEAQVVFTEKSNNAPPDPALLLVQNLRATFSEEDFGKLLQILDAMYEEPTRLHTIHALLKND